LTLKNTPTTSNASNVSVVSLCNDSDGGNFTFKRGSAFGRYTTGVSFNLTDSCFVSGGVSRIREFFCVSNVVREGNYTCQYGCSNGACLSAPVTNTTNTSNTTVPKTNVSVVSLCNDSDGGNFTFKRGSAFGRYTTGVLLI
jgi:hypothetical protein